MAEYIGREAALDAVKSAFFDQKCDCEVMPDIFRSLQAVEVADVAEVRHGRWIFEPGKIPYCSECKEYSDDGDKDATFCPWCGAHLDKEDEHVRND